MTNLETMIPGNKALEVKDLPDLPGQMEWRAWVNAGKVPCALCGEVLPFYTSPEPPHDPPHARHRPVASIGDRSVPEPDGAVRQVSIARSSRFTPETVVEVNGPDWERAQWLVLNSVEKHDDYLTDGPNKPEAPAEG